MRTYIKFSVFGLLLLLLFHFESLSLGPVKISHLWKGILLLFLIIKILSKKRNNLLIYKPLIWLALFQLINLELFNNPFNAAILFGTTLILPLLGIYTLSYTPNQLKNGLLFFASFFILSFVPYELGILKSLEEGYRLTSYGVQDSDGVIGPFQTVHSASTALAGSFITLLYFWFTKSFNRIYLSTLLILCFYFLIFTYVRTGMAMVVLGAIPMLIYFAKKEASTRFRLIFFGSIFSILISGWVLSNETLMDRITGNRVSGASETESFESLGSGRGLIYTFAVEIFMEANVFEKLIGIGQTEQKSRMENKLGSALIPHNGFLLLLLNNGLIGLMLFLTFIRKLNKLISQYAPSHRSLLKGLLYAYLVMTFFQNYDMIYMYLILALGIALTYKINIHTKYSTIK